jgi:dipeptidyl aminopeptidase/acylaminoacyl peptidase
MLAEGRSNRLAHPPGVSAFVGFSPYGDILASIADSTSPSRIAIIDSDSGEEKGVAIEPAPAPAGRAWRSFNYLSSDGQEIQGWVATPQGTGPFPLIFETHGGPTWGRFTGSTPATSGFSWIPSMPLPIRSGCCGSRTEFLVAEDRLRKAFSSCHLCGSQCLCVSVLKLPG